MELENKELLEITKQSNSYEEFISNINYDLTHILTLGDLFLSLLIIYHNNLFEKDYNKAESYMRTQ